MSPFPLLLRRLLWRCHCAHAYALVNVLVLGQGIDQELAQMLLGHDASSHWLLVRHLELTLGILWKII